MKLLLFKLVMLMTISSHLMATTETTSTADVKVDDKATLETKCGFVADSKAKSSTGAKVDPFDAYIDCATQMDYKTVYDKLSVTQKDFLVERCMMFEIQNEMGAGGEAAMSTADIQAYEKMIKAKCTCIKEGKVFTRTGMSGTCSSDVPKDPIRDLFMYTMDGCTKHLDKIDNVCTKGATNGKTETPGVGVWEESCKNDLRFQCYQFLTIPSVFQEPVNPVLNKCNFGDQTKIISQQCRSYCYQHNTCAIGEEGSFHAGGGGLGNAAIDPKFKNRKIGNVYLLRKLGMSSCVKGTSFGIESNGTKLVGANPETGEPGKKEYSLYADQSCYAEIAVQYKDPDCGWRPTCEPLPAPQNGQNIPRTGTSIVEKRCDGTGVKNMGANDKDGVYCEVKVPDENAPKVAGLDPLSVLPDDTKVITNINSIELVKKFGPATCNPGGNGAPKDYQPKDYRSEERGMGIQVHKGCQADFKVSVNWVRKDCTMAGEKTSSDTCCQSLIWDSETKICNSPVYDVPELTDTEKMKLTGETCKANFNSDAKTLAAKYMQELGAYDQMFTMLNEKADEYFKTIQAERTNAKFDLKAITPAPDSQYDLIKKSYEAFWKFKQSMIDSRKLYIDSTTLLKAQLNDYITLIGSDDGKSLNESQKAELEKNVFFGSPVQEATTKISHQMLNDLELAYTNSIVNDFNKFQIDIFEIEQVGINLTWLCAHKENCTSNNWLIKNTNADDPAVIDYFLDPAYPIQIGPVGGLLPRIGGVSRTLIPSANYTTYEKALSDKENMSKFLNYEDITVKDQVQDNDKEKIALQMYRKFSTELPLRKDSMLKGTSIENYLDDDKNSKNKTHLPYYCKAQEDGYEIRVPVGKALEPMRLMQVATLLRAYFEEANRGVSNQKECYIKTTYGNTANVGPTTNAGAGGSPVVDGNPDATKVGTATGKLLANVPGLGGTSFGEALANLGITNGAKATEVSSDKTSGADTLSNSTNGNSNAIAFKKLKDQKLTKQKASIDKRKTTHKDKLITKYVKSMNNSFGSALAKKDLGAVGRNLFNGGFNDKNSNSTSTNTNSGTSNSNNAGNGSYTQGTVNYTNGSGSGSGSNGSSGSGSNSGQNNNGVQYAGNADQNDLQNAIKNRDSSGGTERYKTTEDDSIFDVITKAYIRNYDKVNRPKLDK